jgi:hypothetical protein
MKFSAWVFDPPCTSYNLKHETFSQGEFLKDLAMLELSFTGIHIWWLGLSDLGKQIFFFFATVFLVCICIFLHCLGDEGHWMWTHSHEFLTDSFWGTNMPNSQTGNQYDCATLFVYTQNEAWWEDHTCWYTVLNNWPVAPICQFDVSAAASNSTIL